MSKKAVVFDLDGTLLDTLDDLTGAVNYILRKHGYRERTSSDIRDFLGNGARVLIKRSLPEGVDDDVLSEYLLEYMEYYNENSHIETKPYEGVIALLGELKKHGIATVVVSNKPDVAVKTLCCEYFGDLIDFAVGDREDIDRKPSADPVKYAMNTVGSDKAVFVGDSEVDILAAKNAGLPCISLTWGFRDRDVLEKCGGYCFADNADQLKAHIFELLSENEV